MKNVKNKLELKVVYVPIETLLSPEYNPRAWSEDAIKQLTQSIKRFGMVDPLIVNSAPGREGIVIGGNFRLKIAKDLGIQEVPVVHVNISNLEKEKEICLRLNKNVGEFDWNKLASFGEDILTDIGFSSEELDEIFGIDDIPEEFNLEKELKKLKIDSVKIKKGEVYRLGPHRLKCGDSTKEEDILDLMNGEKADMCLTDPPYILDYLHTKYKGKGPGFGYRKNRKYLETDVLPPDFTEKWMANINKIQKDDFSIICYENWKNVRIIMDEMEKHWKIRNVLIWHCPNRTQGFAAKYHFFSKYDIAAVGTSGEVNLNLQEEEELFQNEYETAVFATAGRPHWESYKKGKKICPKDFIEFNADDAKHSGQSVVFGTKPTEILVPYIKVLTKRNDLIIEPFGGSGSTLIAAEKMGRRCYLMEKSTVYCEVIRARWNKFIQSKAGEI